MRRLAVDLDSCVEEAYRDIEGLRVRIVRVRREAPPAELGAARRPRGPVLLYVKSLNASLDELPVVASMVDSARGWPHGIEVYEYESLGGEGDRYAKFSRLLAEAMRRGRPFLALVPQLMTVRLLEGLSGPVAEALESSVAATIEVEKEDLLYLPRYTRDGSVEIVAKESSASSPERAETLRARAVEAGLRVRGVKRLPDNSSILDYVLEWGLCTALERVPVTRLARLIYSTFKCTGLSGLALGLRTGGGRADRSMLTLYSYSTPPEVLESLLDSLERLAGAGWVSAGELLRGPASLMRGPLLKALRGDMAGILRRWWCPAAPG